MYKLKFLKAIRKDFKKLSAQARDFIISRILPRIQEDPYERGAILRGELRNCRKFTVSFKGVNYRVAYQVDEPGKVVLIIAIGSREGFYNRLLRRLNS